MLNTALKAPFIADHAGTSSRRRNLYVNKTDLFVCTYVIIIFSRCLQIYNFKKT